MMPKPGHERQTDCDGSLLPASSQHLRQIQRDLLAEVLPLHQRPRMNAQLLALSVQAQLRLTQILQPRAYLTTWRSLDQERCNSVVRSPLYKLYRLKPSYSSTTVRCLCLHLISLRYPWHTNHELFNNVVSEFIAPKMVVFDFNGNGYRNILLPLACEDDLVGQAISVISAFHLSQRAPHLRMAAEVGQQAILSKLFRDSLQLEPRKLFSLSTWATILVLLVGETITGANNYVHLLEILSNLAQSSASVSSLSKTTREFIREQTRM